MADLIANLIILSVVGTTYYSIYLIINIFKN